MLQKNVRYHGTSEIGYGLCGCTADNPLTKARGLSFRSGAQTTLYLILCFTGNRNIGGALKPVCVLFGVITENPCSKPLERNLIYILIIPTVSRHLDVTDAAPLLAEKLLEYV